MTSDERMVLEAVLPLFRGLDEHPEEWVTYCNLISDKFRDCGREHIADRIAATRGDWPPQPNTRCYGIAEPSVVMASLCLASSWSDRPLIPEPASDNRILREVLDACIACIAG